MAVDLALDPLVTLVRDREDLDIEANLSITVDGQAFALSDSGDRVVVHAPSVGACLGVGEAGRLPELAALLDAAGVTVEVRTGDAVLAVVGADAAPGELTAALFSDAVEPRLSGVIAGLLRLQ